jgi:hypothetical protein
VARFLTRAGGLILVAALVYLAWGEVRGGGADPVQFRRLILAGAASVALGVVFWILGRGVAGIVARSCPRCGRRVARGRIYCEEHRQETINEYRDRQEPK